MRNFYFTSRFYYVSGAVIALFALSFYFTSLFTVSMVLLVFHIATTISDTLLLFSKQGKVNCNRQVPNMFSLNDENKVELSLKNGYAFRISVDIIDEVPIQFQYRDFAIKGQIEPNQAKNFSYTLVPNSRGLYTFNQINIIISSPIALVQKRQAVNAKHDVKVYPSVQQMKHFQLHVAGSVRQFDGLKKIQRIGHSYEFDHIKNYVMGEDTRSINWKASSRRNELMVNHYTDEKSQQVYCLLNKSRLMNMPFNGLSLLDYAINTSLTISNIVLNKSDKMGLMSFSNKLGTIIKANRNGTQLQQILNALYNEKESELDPNYELLYSAVRYFVPVRSLLFLFTNFETLDSLERNIDILRRLNRFHLLVPIIFENSELDEFITEQKISTDLDIYNNVIARKMKNEKEIICNELRNYGIQHILTKPEDLSVNTINKYLELKARGMI